MPSTIAEDIRGTLATALAGVTATVYDYVPEAVIPSAVVIVPDSPYLQPNLINKTTLKLKVNMVLSAIVAYNSNPGSLDNLEKLVIEILASIPGGFEVGDVGRPTVTQIGAGKMLVSDISVSTYYTQTN